MKRLPLLWCMSVTINAIVHDLVGPQHAKRRAHYVGISLHEEGDVYPKAVIVDAG
jgi:hypothetical protein